MFFLKKVDFLLNVHPFVPSQAPSPMCCILIVRCFLSSMMCYSVPGLSGILDFSSIYHVLEKKSLHFCLFSKKNSQNCFPL